MGAEAQVQVRDRIAIALDVDDLVAAVRIAKQVREHIGVAKIGLELYSAVGPDAIVGLTDLGFAVFADIKLHDIPTTVGRAATVFGSLGVRYLNFHAAGGEAMLRAGVEGLLAGADRAGLPVPTALAVTVLTSDVDAPASLLAERAGLAVATGCGGVVCAAADIAAIRAVGPDLVCVTPGIRPGGVDLHDQARAATPAEAIAAGAAAAAIHAEVTGSTHT
jgi:orotidine-5'-phosphate decarboxylase